jgi:uncharacterized membrane protein
MKAATERRLHRAFEAGMLLKGAFAVAEVVSGLGLALLSTSAIAHAVGWLTHEELARDPGDLVAGYLFRAAGGLSLDTKTFAALYLASHGLIKLCLVIALLRGLLWAYPVSIVAFGGFIAYQLHRFSFSHSPMLLVLTAVDLVVVGLVANEWRERRRHLTEV